MISFLPNEWSGYVMAWIRSMTASVEAAKKRGGGSKGPTFEPDRDSSIDSWNLKNGGSGGRKNDPVQRKVVETGTVSFGQLADCVASSAIGKEQASNYPRFVVTTMASNLEDWALPRH